MAIVKLQFDKPNRNVDETSLTSNLYVLQDVYRDESGAFRRRPGLELFKDLATGQPIDGNYWWDKKGRKMYVSNGDLYSVTSGAVATKLTAGANVLEASGITRFTEAYKTGDTTLRLFAANGGRILYTDNSAVNTTKMIGADDPVTCTHVAMADGYLVANDTTYPNNWTTSPVNNQTTFTGGGDYAAPSMPDDIQGLIELNRRIYVFGRQSIEPWYDSGGTIPWVRVNDALVNIGTYSANAICRFSNDLYFMTSTRQIARLRGYDIEIISKDYDGRIQALSTIDDVFMEVIAGLNGRNFLMVVFPSEDLTLVYNIELSEWMEWGKWNGATYNRFLGQHPAYAVSWGYHTIGSNTDGKVYKLSNSLYTDAGTTIKSKIITGKIDHGTNKNKYSRALLFKVKRGDGKTGNTGSAPVLYVRWRDDGVTDWGTSVELSLGALGDRETVLSITPMGRYRNRQYEITFGDNANLVISGIEEDVEVLDV